MSTSLAEAVLVTIICETVLQDRLVRLLKTLNVSGYTVVQAQGAGRHGSRMGDIAGFKTNIELKTVVSPEVSDKLLSELQQYQATHALIAFRQPVEALID